jgi:hypothetical protein
MNMSKNNNNRKKTANQSRGIRNLPKKQEIKMALANQQSELDVYDAACALVKMFMDPTQNRKGLVAMTAEPLTKFRPHNVVNLSQPPEDSSPFVVIVSPSLRDPVYLTDYAKSGDSFYLGRREFTYKYDAQDVLLTSPPGRDEEATGFKSRNIPTGGWQMKQTANLDNSILLSHWDQTKLGGSGAWTWKVEKSLEAEGVNVTVRMDFDGVNDAAGMILNWLNEDGTAGVDVGVSAVDGQTLTFTAAIPVSPGKVLREIWIQYIPSNSAILIRNVRMNVNYQSPLAPQFNLLHVLRTGEDVSTQVESSAERFIMYGQFSWIQYNGSTLENGGTIAGRQILKNQDLIVPLGEFYDRISRMPKSYTGALKDGCYQFYVPSDAGDQIPRSVHERGVTSKLVMAGTLDNRDSTLKLTVGSTVYATNTSNIFDGKNMINSRLAYDIALSYMAPMKNTMCNSHHTSAINKVYNQLYKHRELIKKGAHTAMSVAKVLGPALAAALL